MTRCQGPHRTTARRFAAHAAIGAVSMMAVIAAAGCVRPPGKEASRPAVDTGNKGPASPAAPTAPADLRSIVDSVTRDAASRLRVDPGTVEVVSARQVTWSDGSLGCPEDGRMYTQALVPGFRVIVRAGGQTLDYHAAANGHFALCPRERTIEPVADPPV